MNVVAHEAERKNPQVELLAIVLEPLQVPLSIRVISKHRGSLVATHHHVVTPP